MTTDKIEFKCSSCGSKLFEHPTNPKPDDIVTCAGCGRTARYGDLRDAALKQGKEFVDKSLRDMLKKAGFK